MLMKRGFDFDDFCDPMITIPLIWPNRKNLPETFKLLCEKEVAQHNDNIDDIEIGSKRQMQEKDFQEWITEVKKYVPKTFGIGYYLSQAHKGFFIGFLLLGVFDFVTDIRLTTRYYTDFGSFVDQMESASERNNSCTKYPAFHYMEYWHHKMKNRTWQDDDFVTLADEILRCLSLHHFQPGISCRNPDFRCVIVGLYSWALMLKYAEQ
jgi:hypothetical protein